METRQIHHLDGDPYNNDLDNLQVIASVDYDQPDLIPAAERAIRLLGREVTAHVHGPMDQHPIAGTVSDWGYDSGGVVVWVDGEEVWQHDCVPT